MHEWIYPTIGISNSHFKSVGYRLKWPMYFGSLQSNTTQRTMTIRMTDRGCKARPWVKYQQSFMRSMSLRRDQLVSVVMKTANVLYQWRLVKEQHSQNRQKEIFRRIGITRPYLQTIHSLNKLLRLLLQLLRAQRKHCLTYFGLSSSVVRTSQSRWNWIQVL